ncbi:DUF1295 domain-containing protein [Streptomyces oceani]|uniref:Uncharacterized protein n=1 Tax=Streptomyces oceani TaxID=1075402 RepID=A0A1E7KJY9_9ACTN|nr:DUF1295 domain-containing protein [Streptomyces oceani]OEV04174.1 hypothetical protein AN216_08165 [Streptomyces oceani]
MNGLVWSELARVLPATAGAALIVLLVTYARALAKGVHRIVDVAWGLAFTAVAVVTYLLSADEGGDHWRRLLLTACTALWGLRLAAHIARRGSRHGGREDPRYARLLSRAPGNQALYALWKVYLAQAALVWLVSLPVQAGQYVPAPVGPVALAGVVLWATGLFFEAVGDAQLARFQADSANRGRIMDRGLWAWTRHPNYFGDCCVWWGLFLLAAGSWSVAGATVIAPLVMTALLTVGSGKRLLERDLADRPGFAEYAARTSGFLPLPPRRGRPPRTG